MKLPQLLAQFLYQTKKLDLPGIGSFTLDPAAIIPEESDKIGQTVASGISFKNMLVKSPEDALIQFIKEHTGKMKPLAAADLDFFLTTGRQLLNIGKPFYLEGIGTLMQNKEGRLDFTPGEYSTARLQDAATEKKERSERKTAAAGTGYDEPPREYEPRSNTARQALLLIGLIGGLVVIGWGGYKLYKRNTFVEPTVENRPVEENQPARKTNTPPADSSKNPQTAGSNGAQTGVTQAPPGSSSGNGQAQKPPAGAGQTGPAVSSEITAPPGTSLYRFIILETTKKGKALRRYNQLLGYQLNIKMDQKDSSYFKLYFPIAAAIRDTTHIKDSLVDIYAAHVTIEH